MDSTFVRLVYGDPLAHSVEHNPPPPIEELIFSKLGDEFDVDGRRWFTGDSLEVGEVCYVLGQNSDATYHIYSPRWEKVRHIPDHAGTWLLNSEAKMVRLRRTASVPTGLAQPTYTGPVAKS